MEYSDYTLGSTLLDHKSIMAAADSLLRGDPCKVLDSQFEDAGEYYVVDHQKQIDETCCRAAILPYQGYHPDWCVDMMMLLLNIDTITTKQQAATLANR